MSLKTLQMFDHVHCPRVSGKKQNLEESITETAS